MSQPQYTPAEWYVDPRAPHLVRTDAFIIAEVSGSSAEELAANAALIAAAPRLFRLVAHLADLLDAGASVIYAFGITYGDDDTPLASHIHAAVNAARAGALEQ